MKLPEKATQVEIYINVIIYRDNEGTTRRYIPPKWLQKGLSDFWNRGRLSGQKSIRDVLKDMVR